MTTPRLRVSIVAMMAAVLLAGLGLAAMRDASFAGLKAAYTSTVVLLLLSVLAGRYRPEPEGAFWFGFAVFGWGYFLVGIAPWTGWSRMSVTGHGDFLQIEANPLLPTRGWMESLAYYRAAHLRPGSRGRDEIPTREAIESEARSLAAYQVAVPNLVGIGHCLFTSAFGLVGGTTAWVLARRRGLATPSRFG